VGSSARQDFVFKGDRIAGRYLLEKEIGRGGHGVVYRALDEQRGERIALKVIAGELAQERQFVLRLWREAQALAALWGTSVVRVYEFDTDARGFVYMAMELLEGEPLDLYLQSLEGFGHRMSVASVVECLAPMAHALGAAHAQGIIHRDVKPGNIFLLDPAPMAGARLMDFGLAKTMDFEAITESGMIAGSPSYIAPEVWDSAPFDHRIDVYSLAAVVFRTLSGRPPFVAESTLDLYHLTTNSPRPSLAAYRPEMPIEIDTWIERALAIDAGHRYPDVASMWADFESIALTSETPSVRFYRHRHG
jgi:serine/threonine protein kinase